MERLDIAYIAHGMAILNPHAPLTTASSEVDWLCGHCDEVLIHRKGDTPNDWVVPRRL